MLAAEKKYFIICHFAVDCAGNLHVEQLKK